MRTARTRRLELEYFEGRDVPALTIQIDYSFDTSGFFNDPTRRAIIEQAAKDLGSHIDTPLAAIVPGGGNSWVESFVKPATGRTTSVANPVVGADSVVVYVAGRYLAGSTVGVTVAGTASESGSAAWSSLIRNRGPAGGTIWGGSTAFDTAANWFFGLTTDGIRSSQPDFYSAAVHELGHILGFGSSDLWDAQTVAGSFTGPNAESVYGGPVPLSGDGGHWANSLAVSGVRAAMDPVLLTGGRVPFSALDYAALADIGWALDGTAAPTSVIATQAAARPWAGRWTPLSAAGSGLVVLSGTTLGTAQAFGLDAGGTLVAVGPTITPFAGGAAAIRGVVGDFDGDGTPDLAFGTGNGSAAAVRILNGRTGLDLVGVTQVLDGFGSGVFLAAGDADGDGAAELAVSADAGGGTRVTLFHVGRGLAVDADFIAFGDPQFRGGSRVALGDVNHDGRADLIVGAGIGGGPRVAVYDGAALAAGSAARLVPDFFALDPALRSGVFVTTADLDADGYSDVIYSTGNTGGPRIRIVSGAVLTDNPGANAFTLDALADFFALDPNDRNGLRIAARDLDGDGRAELVVASGRKHAAAEVRVLTLADVGNPTGPTQDPFNGLLTLDGIYVG